MDSDALKAAVDAYSVSGRITEWLLATERQYERVLTSTSGDIDRVEIGLFVLAAAQLRVACRMAIDYATVARAAAAFDARLPHLKDVRDLITHFDEYDRGNGRLQARSAVPEVIPTRYEYDPPAHRRECRPVLRRVHRHDRRVQGAG